MTRTNGRKRTVVVHTLRQLCAGLGLLCARLKLLCALVCMLGTFAHTCVQAWNFCAHKSSKQCFHIISIRVKAMEVPKMGIGEQIVMEHFGS